MKKNAKSPSSDHILFIGESNKGRIIQASEILYLAADGNYCRVYLEGNDEFVVCRTLRSYEEELNPKVFFRCHKSYLVNVFQIREYHNRKNEFVIVLRNNNVIQVARRRISDLKKFLQLQFSIITKYPDN